MIGTQWTRTMSGMTTQAQESGWLPEQIVGHSAVRLVADRAVFSHRRMFVRKWPLLLSVTLVTNQVHCRFFEIVFGLPVRIVAIRAHHLAFFDRVMRRHRSFRVYLRVALVTGLRLIYRHRHAWMTIDVRVLDVEDRLYV